MSREVRDIIAMGLLLLGYGFFKWGTERQHDTTWEMSPKAVFARLNRSEMLREEMMEESVDGTD